MGREDSLRQQELHGLPCVSYGPLPVLKEKKLGSFKSESNAVLIGNTLKKRGANVSSLGNHLPILC